MVLHSCVLHGIKQFVLSRGREQSHKITCGSDTEHLASVTFCPETPEVGKRHSNPSLNTYYTLTGTSNRNKVKMLTSTALTSMEEFLNDSHKSTVFGKVNKTSHNVIHVNCLNNNRFHI